MIRTDNDNLDAQVLTSLDLTLVLDDPEVVRYLLEVDDEDARLERAVEALKVGVIALRSASPTLDTRVVQARFAELDREMKASIEEFQRNFTKGLTMYFEEGSGVVPASIEAALGENGSLGRLFEGYFDPTTGQVCRLIESQIGPESSFAKTLDPEHKGSVISLIEAKTREIVEAKLDDVLRQFSLDENDSAMCRLKEMLDQFFQGLNRSLGIKEAVAVEAARGTQKGRDFETALYDVFAAIGGNVGDETEFVHGTPGAIPRCKTGDHVATLGEESGAPGRRIVVEVKDSPIKLKDAIDELQKAKENRTADIGIYVFSRGAEPPEVADFRRIGEDFFVTVDKEALEQGDRQTYFESAYKIARALVVAGARKAADGEVDLQAIRDNVDALMNWSDRIASMATKARTVQSHGKAMEEFVNDLQAELDDRLGAILKTLGAKS